MSFSSLALVVHSTKRFLRGAKCHSSELNGSVLRRALDIGLRVTSLV